MRGSVSSVQDRPTMARNAAARGTSPCALRSIEDVVRSKLCVSCGACMLMAPPGKLSWVYSKSLAQFVPTSTIPGSGGEAGEALAVCPGKGVELMRLAETLRSLASTYDQDLGYVLGGWAVRSTDRRLLENSSSGGVITSTAHYLLSTGRVSGVVATRFVYGPAGPSPETIIARDREALVGCQGSKYCPVSIHGALETIRNRDDRLAFIGTPCQIEALRMMQERTAWLKERVVFVIGLFCGGIKNHLELQALIRRQGMAPEDVVQFRFRGGGPPSGMAITDKNGRQRFRPYPDYGTDTGFRKLDRCRLCIDGTAELADLSCGDAWLEKYSQDGRPWSIALARNESAASLMAEMIERGVIEIEPIHLDEVRHSQRANLSGKKRRQAARRRLYGVLRRAVPAYDGGYPSVSSSLRFEVQVHLRHAVLRWLEALHLYWLFIRCARWLRGTNQYRRTARGGRRA